MAVRDADRQAQLLDIARRQFAENGFAGTSLREIAEEAGVTKAALYYHFPNKEALYQQILLAGITRLLASVESAVDAAGDQPPVRRLRVFMDATADYIEHNRHEWLASTNTFWVTLDRDRRKHIVQKRDAFEQLLRRCIGEAMACGDLRADLEPAMAGRMLLSMINHFVRWYDPSGPLSAREVVARFLDMTIFGLAAPGAPAERLKR